MRAPEIPEDVTFAQLDRNARGRLRTLSKDNAEGVGRHLVMAGRLLDSDPELAYEHAQAAVRRAGRVDVVREAAALTAYHTGRYAEALRELRTVRRLNGSSEHLPLMADCERGLGRPERALALAASAEAETLSPQAKVELAIVVSGARADLREYDAALAALPKVPAGPLATRVAEARAAVLEACGRTDEAAEILAGLDLDDEEPEEEVVVYDLEEDAVPVDDVVPAEDVVPGEDVQPGENVQPAEDAQPGEDAQPAKDAQPGEAPEPPGSTANEGNSAPETSPGSGEGEADR